MKPSKESALSGLPFLETETDATYTLAIVAELTGVATQQILYYQETGLIAPVAGTPKEPAFDVGTLRALRRIEHLRSGYGVNDSGLRLLLNLLDEVDYLRNELRERQRVP